ncbi:hypothetical protein OAB00_00925 [Akkermansiaceae bacterium]|nr:hypothetical protein [Akkermansiaceae bacterium]
MTTIEFSLYRIKFIRPIQSDIMHNNDLTPQDFFISALKEKPSYELKAGSVWHIGNLEFYENDLTGTFAVGRTSKSKQEQYDEQSKDFIDSSTSESPYTTCYFNTDIGFLVIGKKNNLSPKSDIVTNQLVNLLSSTSEIFENDIRVEIEPIPDPEKFINKLKKAHTITSFTATFGGPNPKDSDEYFQRPMSVYLNEANGTSGRTVIQGDNLASEALIDVTKSTAATGNEASAKVKITQNSEFENIHLNGGAVKRRIEESESGRNILKKFHGIYNLIRGNKL